MRVTAFHSPASRLEASHGQALPGFAARLIKHFREWLHRRAVLAELQGLDERTLGDLCLYPGDFQAIADGTHVREGGAHDVARKPAAESARIRPYY
jgi:uncharacterized protein YjiS (DUF1127 family)